MEFTFDGIKKEFIDRLSSTQGFSKILFYGLIERLVDVTAFIFEKLNYVVEFLYRESNLSTAVLPQSIIPRTQILSYKESRKIGATGYVEVTSDANQMYYSIVGLNSTTKTVTISGGHVTALTGKIYLQLSYSVNNDGLYTISSVTLNGINTDVVVVQDIDDTVIDGEVYVYQHTGNSILIPKWHTFYNLEKTSNVYAVEDVEYPKNKIGNLSVPVREGTPKEFIYTSSGEVSEKFEILSENIDNDLIEIYIVDGLGNILNTVKILGLDGNPSKFYFVNDLTTA